MNHRPWQGRYLTMYNIPTGASRLARYLEISHMRKVDITRTKTPNLSAHRDARARCNMVYTDTRCAYFIYHILFVF